MLRKVLAVSLLLALLVVPSYGAAPNKDIIIVYTNDVHCGVEDHIGYAGFALYRNEMRKLTPYVTTVDAGDFAQGATIGAISQGRYIIEIMNAVGYDVTEWECLRLSEEIYHAASLRVTSGQLKITS